MKTKDNYMGIIDDSRTKWVRKYKDMSKNTFKAVIEKWDVNKIQCSKIIPKYY